MYLIVAHQAGIDEVQLVIETIVVILMIAAVQLNIIGVAGVLGVLIM